MRFIYTLCLLLSTAFVGCKSGEESKSSDLAASRSNYNAEAKYNELMKQMPTTLGAQPITSVGKNLYSATAWVMANAKMNGVPGVLTRSEVHQNALTTKMEPREKVPNPAPGIFLLSNLSDHGEGNISLNGEYYLQITLHWTGEQAKAGVTKLLNDKDKGFIRQIRDINPDLEITIPNYNPR